MINKKNNNDVIEIFNDNILSNDKSKKNTIVSINNLKNDKKQMSLILNNQIIQIREYDNYINATQLCKSGNKKFNDWIRLDITKELISVLASDAGIPASLLIDSKKGNSNNFEQGTWIHPDLAIQLAQWISPLFAIQVSQWIRKLFTDGKVEINLKLIKEQENIIKECNHKIKLLQNIVLRKQKRIQYPEQNVVYLITTEDNKNKRIYIIGKAVDLKDRLSSYNKTCEHEVIYYKSFKNIKKMDLAENMVLELLDEYREKANRDRFILPLEKNVKLFTNSIDKSFNFFN